MVEALSQPTDRDMDHVWIPAALLLHLPEPGDQPTRILTCPDNYNRPPYCNDFGSRKACVRCD